MRRELAVLRSIAEGQRYSASAWMLAILVYAISFGAVAWRLDQSPDVFTDEAVYTRAAIRVAGEGALVWDSGEPFLVHPPLYFLAQGAVARLTADQGLPVYEAGDIFHWVQHARYVNAVLAGLTAVLMYFLGLRIRSVWLGLALVALFVLDPFGVRTNRRAMLETLAALLTLGGVTAFLPNRGQLADIHRSARAVTAGFLLGLSMLAKELSVIVLLSMLLFALWETWLTRCRGSRVAGVGSHYSLPPSAKAASSAIAVAAITYALYPLWTLLSGSWRSYAEVKSLLLMRLLGIIQLTGWNRPDVSFYELLDRRLADYGSSYLVLVLGGAALLWLLMFHRGSVIGRFMCAWGLVLYPFYGFVALFGSGNDQFFYYLLVPAIVFVGYAALVTPPGMGESSVWSSAEPRAHAKAGWIAHNLPLVMLALLVLILPYNAAKWWTSFGVGVDDGYKQVARFVQGSLPSGVPVNASGDDTKFFYFFPQHPIADAATPGEALSAGVHYFVLAPRDVRFHYGPITQDLANWITEHGQRLLVSNGDSYGDIFIYRVDYDSLEQSRPTGIPANRSRWMPYLPASSGFIGILLAELALWTVLLAVIVVRSSRPKTKTALITSSALSLRGQPRGQEVNERA